MVARLPQPGADDGTWGDVLNDFLLTEHNADGTHKSGPTPVATATTYGTVQLSGDLGGTASAPTVPGLGSKADNSAVVHLAGTETISGNKDFSGALTKNGTAVALVSDARLSDNRTPTAHAASHATGGSDPVTPAAIGAASIGHVHTAQVIPDADATTKGLVRLTGDFGGTADAPTVPGLAAKANDTAVVHLAGAESITGNKDFTGTLTLGGQAVVSTNDSRLSDSRTPAAHAASHSSGGSDPVSPVNIGAAPAVHQHPTISATTKTADYTLALVDAGTVVEMDLAAPGTLTVPADASVAFPVGTLIEILQLGVGTVTVAPAAGVTLRTAATLSSRAQYSSVGLRKRAANEWIVAGDLS